VLCVAGTHVRSFATLDDTAAEKATLLDYLPSDGAAILNVDDPRVRKMADGCKTRVVLFGQTEDCDLKAEGVGSAWPDRLHFTLQVEGDTVPVQTQLVGKHWVTTALASIAAARACGLTTVEAVRGLANVAPSAARMQPVRHPSGAIVIRDEETSSPDTLAPMFDVMREARATRRVLVFSDIDESRERPRNRLQDVGRVAAELTGLAIFVGEHSRYAVRAAVDAGMPPEWCHDTNNLEEAADLLKRELRDGDLVFVKGKMTDHLSRIVFAQFGSIGCWTTACRLRPLCELCAHLRPTFDLQAALAGVGPSSESHDDVSKSLN
jgi:UDP-N-acetylmuramoyl-tripeptide--D-alanyl-D-alanine ligase